MLSAACGSPSLTSRFLFYCASTAKRPHAVARWLPMIYIRAGQRGSPIELADIIRLWDGLLECRVDGDTLKVSGGYVGGFWLFWVGTFIGDPFLPSYLHHAWSD